MSRADRADGEVDRAGLRAFYDRFGRRQDAQAFYEDAALDEMIRAADFGTARAVLELGAGTGRLAERLLDRELGRDAYYRAFDLSGTMIALALERLRRFGRRAAAMQHDVTEPWDLPDGSVDRIVATYLFDLLSKRQIALVLDRAWHVLAPGGLLCAAGLADGVGPLTRLVSLAWHLIHWINPLRLGGCRPISVVPFLDPARWKVRHRRRLASFGLTSEVVIAERR